jgi:NADH dehydrogenase
MLEARRGEKRMSEQGKTRIVILGAGFAGINAALELQKELGDRPDIDITLVDKHNYFLFIPMLHEAATGLIEPRHVAQPIRRTLRGGNVRFVEADVQSIDLEAKTVLTSLEPLEYDHLVMAMGSVTNFFGLDSSAPHVFELKDLADATTVHNQIVGMFEQASAETSAEERKRLLTFVVAGAGPTGIELALEVHDFIHESLIKDYPDLDPAEVKVTVIEALARVLPSLDEDLAKVARRALAIKRIDTRLNTRITKIVEEGLEINGNEIIRTPTLIWTAGVRANPVVAALPVEKDRGGRVVVNQYLEVEDHPGIYAIGDDASCMNPKTQKPHPPTAQIAVREGKWLAEQIARKINHQSLQPFQGSSVGGLVSLGSRDALVDLYGVKLHGPGAWLIWRVIYLNKLPGWQNRTLVAMDWLFSLFFERSSSQISSCAVPPAPAVLAKPEAPRPPEIRPPEPKPRRTRPLPPPPPEAKPDQIQA